MEKSSRILERSKARPIGAALVVLLFVGVAFLLGNTPQVEPPTPRLPEVSVGKRFVVHVVDVVSKKPIYGAKVQITGWPRWGLTDRQGRLEVALGKGQVQISVQVEHSRYMGTTRTRISTGSTPAVVVAMPPLKQLAKADGWIRDPKTLDPHRKQALIKAPYANQPRARYEKPKGSTINTPIGLTYPLPAKIKVKKTDGSIITLDLEEYLKGVLPREIGTSFPEAAMRAQAVAARTYTIRYTSGGKNPICTTTTCQVWGTTQYAATTKAVLDTKGQVAVYVGSNASYKGKLAGGYFAASCAGSTINSEQKWSFRPFLRAVSCIENKTGACSKVCSLSTCGGGRCSSSHKTCWGVFGHRIGLCQRGAQAMGKCGKSHVEIVKHYYTDTDIANISSPQVDNAKFIRETIPPKTKMRAGQSFTKEWWLENNGTTTWGSGYKLVRIDGTSFGAGNQIPVSGTVGPGKSQGFSIQMKAPSSPGTYKSRWRMDKGGKKFGPEVQVEIVVEAAPNCVDKDKDGFPAPSPGCPQPHDCDDNNKDVHPNAREICGNGKDEDCKDGDAKCPNECKDEDKDGYFAPNPKCPQPHDCNDKDKDVHPGAAEVCGNGKDDDCKGGDAPCSKDCQDKDRDGYGTGSGCQEPKDCDDNDKNVYPGAPEICGNGKDDDCKGGDTNCTGTEPPPRRRDPPAKKKFGESGCSQHSDCESGVCVQIGSKQLCTVRCGEQRQSCPPNYVCVEKQACWPSSDLPGGPNVQCRRETDCPTGQACIGGKCVDAPKKGCGCQGLPGQRSQPWWLLMLAGLWLLSLGWRKKSRENR